MIFSIAYSDIRILSIFPAGIYELKIHNRNTQGL